jgi:O-antigen ligase
VFIIGLSVFFIVLRYLCTKRKTLQTVVLVIISIGFFEALYGLVQTLVPSMGVLWVDYFNEFKGYARGTFINRNHFAGFIEMVWPLALGYAMSLTGRVHSLKTALSSDRLNRQALMALGIVVLLLSLLFSRSRAGILSGFIGIITFSIISRLNNKGKSNRYRWLYGSIFVLLAIYCVVIGIGPILDRFLAIGNHNSRMDFWRDSIPILIDHPFGIGLRNFETVFPIYNTSIISDKTVTFAHNDFLQLLVETGWLGFVSLIGCYLYFLLKSIVHLKAIDSRRDPLRFYLAVGAYSGLISITFHSFFDFNLQIPANCAYFVALLAILHACAWPSRLSSRKPASNRNLARKSHLVGNL